MRLSLISLYSRKSVVRQGRGRIEGKEKAQAGWLLQKDDYDSL